MGQYRHTRPHPDYQYNDSVHDPWNPDTQAPRNRPPNLPDHLAKILNAALIHHLMLMPQHLSRLTVSTTQEGGGGQREADHKQPRKKGGGRVGEGTDRMEAEMKRQQGGEGQKAWTPLEKEGGRYALTKRGWDPSRGFRWVGHKVRTRDTAWSGLTSGGARRGMANPGWREGKAEPRATVWARGVPRRPGQEEGAPQGGPNGGCKRGMSLAYRPGSTRGD